MSDGASSLGRKTIRPLDSVGGKAVLSVAHHGLSRRFILQARCCMTLAIGTKCQVGFHSIDGANWPPQSTCRVSPCRSRYRKERHLNSGLPCTVRRKQANTEERLLRQARADALQSCIEALPLEYREVLVMRELEEMSYRQIAEVAGLAIGTVMSRLFRARKRLKECVGRWNSGGAK
jgi:Sigma-70, region 4